MKNIYSKVKRRILFSGSRVKLSWELSLCYQMWTHSNHTFSELCLMRLALCVCFALVSYVLSSECILVIQSTNETPPVYRITSSVEFHFTCKTNYRICAICSEVSVKFKRNENCLMRNASLELSYDRRQTEKFSIFHIHINVFYFVRPFVRLLLL